ncbi:histidinol dehydrogenase [Coraliomargarita sinensis]|uniref:Histidinol dehydrogenase n=1 Tax=Coraliomargarita sinensis TaxID=2174842 RepID=A0A317ZGG8_9BACT|nr:histidinol dehydrogenase [Coraliomargarita sinensis]PXA04705.1 histidinol dehydrogenase [Coraliomargarita sinensis]
MQKLDYSNSPKFQKALSQFCEKASASGDVSSVVSGVLQDVQKRGDAAVLEYTTKFDGAKMKAPDMRVSADELKAAKSSLSPADRKAIRASIALVKDFHKKTLPKDWKAKNAQGGTVGERFYPIQRVGLYVPGGNVPLVSSVIMSAVLAKLVKCPQIVVCTPPNAEGEIAPGMLAALAMVGIEEIYKVGGVQAIGAMAYGTETVPAVDKIYGPGNAFVMEAKRQVLGTVGIDLLPGPSEVMVIADGGAKPAHVAADLLAQAEHGSGKEIIYFATTSKVLLGKVEKEIEKQLPELSHSAKCEKVMQDRFLAVACQSLSQTATVANYIAPEHLELQVADKSIEPLTKQITTAGAILQGYMTPTVLGDFTAGPSHTLPTGRAGRFFSGLQATDFMRRSSTVRYNAKSLQAAAPVVETFARLEQLDAHGRSLTIRL